MAINKINVSRAAINISIAAALLAACGGSQPPIGALGVSSQNALAKAPVRRSLTRPVLNATSQDLLYAVGGCGGTCVLSYPGGKLVGTLDVGSYWFASDCSDSNGNVFITNNDEVVEYAHGGSSPIATFILPGTQAGNCSIDPMTGNLAVMFSGKDGDVAIFPKAQGTPSVFRSEINSSFCGYDDSGNLFVDGYSGQQLGFSELPIGGTQFQQLSVSKYAPLPPAQVQWDGKFITYESVDHNHIRVLRLQLSGSALNIVGVTRFAIGNAALSWLFGGKIFIPYGGHQFRATRIGVWRYPKGGNPVQRITDFGKYQKKTLELSAVTISVGSR